MAGKGAASRLPGFAHEYGNVSIRAFLVIVILAVVLDADRPDRGLFGVAGQVRGRQRAEILAAFERRADNDAATEFATALAEVHKIALLRLREM